jgi:hypothetical protein
MDAFDGTGKVLRDRQRKARSGHRRRGRSRHLPFSGCPIEDEPFNSDAATCLRGEREAGASRFRVLIDAVVWQRRRGNLPRSVYELHLETGEEDWLSWQPFAPTVYAVVFPIG